MAVDDAVARHRERVLGDPHRETAADRQVGLEGRQQRREALRPACDEHVEVRRPHVEQRRERFVAVAAPRSFGRDDADALVAELAQLPVEPRDHLGDAREECDPHRRVLLDAAPLQKGAAGDLNEMHRAWAPPLAMRAADRST
jgi:hypothetical protein